jgi:hypothetical protein
MFLSVSRASSKVIRGPTEKLDSPLGLASSFHIDMDEGKSDRSFHREENLIGQTTWNKL